MISNEIMVSICCQTYNHDKYLEKCLNSFVSQKTNFKFEILVHEDASTDNTAQILKEYESNYPHLFRCVYQTENQFLKINSLANILMEMAKGKYIAICEGDDFWLDEKKLQKQVDLLERNNQYSMCFTNSIIVDEFENIKKLDRVPEDKKHNLSQSEILSGYCPPANTVLLRTKFVKIYLEYFDGFLNGDFFLFSLLAQHGEVAYFDEKTAAYRMHSNGVWSNKESGYRLLNFIKVNKRLENLVLEENKNIIIKSINEAKIELENLNKKEEYTENGYWTPQTAMLRSIRDAVLKIDGSPQTALSIDNNPTIEKILIRKWPEIEITKIQWPEYDAQNLHQFQSETFDIVFSHQVLEHIPKPWLAASEMNRVLKKGGIGIHSSCAYNPRHGYPEFKDYYRFLPDGLAELFDNVNIWVKEGWGSKEALIYNLAIDDGHGQLGGRRFVEELGKKNDENYPWHTWVIFQKK